MIDLYCPETLETLELTAGRSRLRRRQLTATTLDRLHAALRTGHNFVCASETQRDLWLGAMLALRLIGPELYDRDASLREMIELVPFGVPREPPARVRGRRPARDDRRRRRRQRDRAVERRHLALARRRDGDPRGRRAGARRPRLRLVFMGAAAEHPAAAQSTPRRARWPQQLGAARLGRALPRQLGPLRRSAAPG